MLYVPWVDLCFKGSAGGLIRGGPVAPAAGGLAAVDAATGKVVWRRTFKHLDFGGATVAGDVVFTSTYDGTIYALSTKHGTRVWSTRAPAGINSFPALTRQMLVIGAGARTSSATPHGEVIAYSLP
jgi:alcohol dehydrogenase (cytochrome c)